MIWCISFFLSTQEEQNIKPQYFTFRWLTLLLSQEFLLPDVIRIWDTLFSDQDRFHFLILVCCAMLMWVFTLRSLYCCSIDWFDLWLFMWIVVSVACSQTHPREFTGRRLHSEYEITAGKAFYNTPWSFIFRHMMFLPQLTHSQVILLLFCYFNSSFTDVLSGLPHLRCPHHPDQGQRSAG